MSGPGARRHGVVLVPSPARKGKHVKTLMVVTMAVAFAAGALHLEAAEQPPPTPAEEQPEVLTQGPMHEAFAEPVDLQAQEGLAAPTQPPPDILEKPPADRPAGRRFVWVPGYWAWDPQRQGYVWLSGCWRAAPPNRYWLPGYWSGTDGGWEWVPGFWAPVANVQEIEYLPAPPSIDDVQPPGPPPSSDHDWVPPCWYWHQGRYAWRAGYWLAAQADWVWVPSHYVCAPRGYVFVAGHWDYTLTRRGVLFAPVYFPRAVYARPGFSYSLSVVVDLGMLQFSLFTCPRYSHFFFGDYYDEVNIGFGIFPRFECERRFTWYDPIYVHDRWRHRRIKPGWEAYERREYDRRRVDRDLRPPRTYREMEVRQARMPESQRRSLQVAAPLTRVVEERRSPLKFERIKTDERQRLSAEAGSVRRFGAERRNWESVSPGSKSAQPPAERRRSLTPPDGQGEPVTPPAGREGGATLRGAERGPGTPSTERERPVMPSPEGRDKVTPSEGRDRTVTPSPEGRKQVAPPAERQRPAAPSPERRDMVTPSVGRERPVTPSPEQRGLATPRAAERSPAGPSTDRGPSFAPPRGGQLTAPERVKIPEPPVSDNRGAMRIFRKGPPARPADEQRTEVRSAPRSSGAPGNRDTQRSRDTSRDRR